MIYLLQTQIYTLINKFVLIWVGVFYKSALVELFDVEMCFLYLNLSKCVFFILQSVEIYFLCLNVSKCIFLYLSLSIDRVYTSLKR